MRGAEHGVAVESSARASVTEGGLVLLGVDTQCHAGGGGAALRDNRQIAARLDARAEHFEAVGIAAGRRRAAHCRQRDSARRCAQRFDDAALVGLSIPEGWGADPDAGGVLAAAAMAVEGDAAAVGALDFARRAGAAAQVHARGTGPGRAAIATDEDGTATGGQGGTASSHVGVAQADTMRVAVARAAARAHERDAAQAGATRGVDDRTAQTDAVGVVVRAGIVAARADGAEVAAAGGNHTVDLHAVVGELAKVAA